MPSWLLRECLRIYEERVFLTTNSHSALGGVARMSDPQMLMSIKQAVSIPVMAKCRIGHTVEARLIEASGLDFIDESEVLTTADSMQYIAKNDFKIPFVSGCRNLPEALHRIAEGAAMIRTKGEAGTGNVCEAVKHARNLQRDINNLVSSTNEEAELWAGINEVSTDLVSEVREISRLPVVTFAAGGIATPADGALLMNLGMDGIFVGSVLCMTLTHVILGDI